MGVHLQMGLKKQLTITLLTMHPVTLTMLVILKSAQSITSLADQRCPCKVASECEINFAEMDPADISKVSDAAVQQFIPACPALQRRCCTAETRLITIIELVQLQQQQDRTTTTQPVSSTSLAPVTAATPSVVNIIGPRPVYIGFGGNHGATVHHSSAIGQTRGDKQEQIRALLKLLDKRLKQIAKRLPKKQRQ